MKSRIQKMKEYQEKYSEIPKDYVDRLNYMIKDMPNNKLLDIVNMKRNMEQNMIYNTIKIILYEDPEGAKRPRFRLINLKNYNKVAYESPMFVHVYSPNASEDNMYMKRLSDQELFNLDHIINTQCIITINAYCKTPSKFNKSQQIMSEIGLIRNIGKPDWDNISKKYCDMFNKNIWLDDSLVVSGTTNIFYSILPRIEIDIQYLNCFTNIHHYRSCLEFDTPYLDNYGNIINKNIN